MNADSIETLQEVTRVEIIDETGRVYVRYNLSDVQLVTQDDGRTIKIFVRGKEQ